jgi:hypothetical protein
MGAVSGEADDEFTDKEIWNQPKKSSFALFNRNVEKKIIVIHGHKKVSVNVILRIIEINFKKLKLFVDTKKQKHSVGLLYHWNPEIKDQCILSKFISKTNLVNEFISYYGCYEYLYDSIISLAIKARDQKDYSKDFNKLIREYKNNDSRKTRLIPPSSIKTLSNYAGFSKRK